MNRIDQLFQRKQKDILSVFFTAGYPKLSDTADIVKHLDASQADMIEIGIPYSDPIADGPVIQQSSQAALNNGMNLKLLFEQLSDLRVHNQIPVLLMGYLNPVMQFGIEAFYKRCAEVGIDGLILPDLPLHEFKQQHQAFAEQYHIHVIFLISPETPAERVNQIDAMSKGFIYLVSSNSTTGSNKGIPAQLEESFDTLNRLHLKNPVLIGFGIKGPAEFKTACRLAQGAIVGTAFINMLSTSTDFKNDVNAFTENIKEKRDTVV